MKSQITHQSKSIPRPPSHHKIKEIKVSNRKNENVNFTSYSFNRLEIYLKESFGKLNNKLGKIESIEESNSQIFEIMKELLIKINNSIERLKSRIAEDKQRTIPKDSLDSSSNNSSSSPINSASFAKYNRRNKNSKK